MSIINELGCAYKILVLLFCLIVTITTPFFCLTAIVSLLIVGSRRSTENPRSDHCHGGGVSGKSKGMGEGIHILRFVVLDLITAVNFKGFRMSECACVCSCVSNTRFIN